MFFGNSEIGMDNKFEKDDVDYRNQWGYYCRNVKQLPYLRQDHSDCLGMALVKVVFQQCLLLRLMPLKPQ
jgi:hypothetical protein